MPDPTRDAFNDMVKGFIEDASYGEPAEARLFAEAMAALDALITAARAEGATAERARLAGMASEEDRKMVQHYGYLATEAHRANCSGEACCEAPDRRDANKAEAEALALILARLAAARGEALEEAIRWAWANHERFHVDSEDEAVRDALAALLPRGPDAATGTGVGNG